jgi:glycosyltransferase involved in cell wall biosynthesis
MQKIIILVNTLESGGAEKQSILLLNALKNEYKTTIIVFYGNRIEDKLIQVIEGSNYNLVKLRGNSLKKLIFLYKIFKSNKVSHLFTYLTKPNFYGAIIGRLAGVANIYGGIRTSKLPLWKIILEKIASNYFCTATIFNSYAGENVFKGKGIKRSVVIPNCFPDISAPFERVQKEKLKIITVGRFVPEKDYLTAIKSINFLKNTNDKFIFQIVGYGLQENEIRNIITKFSLENNVEIFINPGNITELLNEADIYLSTSLFEGTSNSIMEAMNASLPIVATNVGDNNKLVLEGANGFLHDVGAYKAIAQSLKTLIDDYKTRIEAGLESNRRLKENYSFEKFKDEYLKLIEQ